MVLQGMKDSCMPCKIKTIQTCEQAVHAAMQGVQEFSTENSKIVYNPPRLRETVVKQVFMRRNVLSISQDN